MYNVIDDDGFATIDQKVIEDVTLSDQEIELEDLKECYAPLCCNQSKAARPGGYEDRKGNMNNWTIEQLYDLWRGRGYTKKEAQAKAEKDYKEMHRKKSETECHKTMQEMLYN